MEDDFDVEKLELEMGLSEDFDLQAEFTCPKCRLRRLVVLKDAKPGDSFACPCGGFAFLAPDDTLRGLKATIEDFARSTACRKK